MTATVSLFPFVCALCTRPFAKRAGQSLGLRCDRCLAVVCRQNERACFALHAEEAHA